MPGLFISPEVIYLSKNIKLIESPLLLNFITRGFGVPDNENLLPAGNATIIQPEMLNMEIPTLSRYALLSFMILVLALCGCDDDEAKIEVNLLEFMPPGAAILVENITVSADSGSTAGHFTWRASPCTVRMPAGTSRRLDVDETALTFEAVLDADQGTEAELSLYFNDGSGQVYGDSASFVLSRRMSLPARFQITSSDPRLNRFFGREQFIVGIKATFFRPPDSGSTMASLSINRFSALVTGRQERY